MAQQKICSLCGTSYECGITDTSKSCWCTDLPNVMPYPGEGDCLCPDCLKAQVEKVIAKSSIVKENNLPPIQ